MGARADHARMLANAWRSPRPRSARAPSVSVVIATYDYSSVLRCAIASALRQSYLPLEVLVIGDGCTDDSEQACASFGDPRVRWHNLAQNSGSQSAPNNAGIARARGELIAYHGHDDVWMPNHLALLIAAMQHSGAELANAATLVLGPPGTNIRDLHGLAPHPDAPGWRAPSSVVHRRAIAGEVGGWRDYRTLPIAPDEEFMGRAAAGRRTLRVPALTVLKLNSTLRPNCYVDKPSHEQEALLRRTRRAGPAVARELAITAWVRRYREPRLPDGFPALEPEPEQPPLGWKVRQYRRIRGLE